MKTFLVILSLLYAFLALAQEPDFKNYTVEDGLPSSECYQILQDRQGYIWIATDRGVSRFDGYKFQNYTRENGLPENCVLRMYLDPKGRIWFVCLSGKMAIYEKGTLKSLPINREILRKVNGGIINSICLYRDTLSLGYTCSSKIVQIVHKNGQFQLLKNPSALNPGAFIRIFPNRESFFGWIVFDRKSIVDPGLDIYHNKTRKRIGNLFHPRINYWFKTSYVQDKLYVINNQELNIISLKNCKIRNKLFDSRLLALKVERSKKKVSIWIGTIKGLLYFNDTRFLARPVTLLNGNSVSDFCRDSEGGVWAATLNNGIYYAKNVRVKNILTHQKVYSMLKHQNKLIVGLENGRILLFDKDGISERLAIPNAEGYPVKRIHSIDKDHILMKCVGVSVYSLKKRKVIKTFDYFASNDFVYDPFRKKGLSFEQSGVAEFDWNTFRIKWIPKEYKMRCYCASPVGNGKTLVGSNLGLEEYDEPKNQLRLIDSSFRDILHITQLGNTLWLGSKENGIEIQRNGKKFHINAKSGLTSNYCCHIYLENEVTAWISTNKGLTRVKVLSWTPFRYKCFPFSKKDGLVCDELKTICKWNNKIVVAGAKGLSIFDESKMVMPEYKPKVYLSELSLNGKKCPVRNYYELKNAIKHLMISFRGLCFRKEGRLFYRYRFKEMDQHWKVTSNTSVEFNGIPYGKMTFELQAQSTNGSWNTPIRRVVLFSPTPFFETAWFRIASILIIGLLVWGFLYWRIRLVKRRAFDREQLYRKASEMELKFLTGQMNPHFTFNAMNSVQHFMLNNDLLKAQNYLTKYSKLIRKVLENNMYEYVDLANELELLQLYLEIESLRFSKQVDFRIDCDSDLMNSCQIPPMFIQPYLENAIWHGLFDDTVENGVIQLTITEEAGRLKCVVEDNGIGREQAERKKKSQEKPQSWGMLITRKRLDHLKDSNFTEPEIIDLYNGFGNPCGTKVIFYLPYTRK